MTENRDFLTLTANRLTGATNAELSPLGRKRVHEPLPSKSEILEMTELLRSALFPGYFGGEECSPETISFHAGAALDKASRILEEQIRRSFCFFCTENKQCVLCRKRAAEITRDFISALPAIQALLATDVQAAYEGDPAARSPSETVLCYPGIIAITNQRLAHGLYVRQVPLVPRIITEHAHSLTGIDIHPGAAVGSHFFIDHGTGVVVGETAVIGAHVKLYQGVTLGAKSFPLDEHGLPVKGVRRHPTVEDGATIYAGATVLGTVTIGARSVIGGNVWLTASVPPDTHVSQKLADKLSGKQP